MFLSSFIHTDSDSSIAIWFFIETICPIVKLLFQIPPVPSQIIPLIIRFYYIFFEIDSHSSFSITFPNNYFSPLNCIFTLYYFYFPTKFLSISQVFLNPIKNFDFYNYHFTSFETRYNSIEIVQES